MKVLTRSFQDFDTCLLFFKLSLIPYYQDKDSESLSDFVVKWQKLSRDQQLQARKSKIFIKLNAELQQRILEIRALKASKNRRAEKQENLLIWFATELSIPVS